MYTRYTVDPSCCYSLAAKECHAMIHFNNLISFQQFISTLHFNNLSQHWFSAICRITYQASIKQSNWFLFSINKLPSTTWRRNTKMMALHLGVSVPLHFTF